MVEPIVTLTLNPALDVSAEADGVTAAHKTRTTGERIDPGGGGINVARVIHELGGETVAVILGGGVTGAYLEELIAAQGVPFRMLSIAGRTRLCTAIHDRADGLEYRFVPEGPLVTEAECDTAIAAARSLPWHWLVASGSLPRGVPTNFYRHAAALATDRGGHLVLDTSGAALKDALGTGITLIKPSRRELESITGHELPSRADQARAAYRLVRDGAARMVALTLGGEGALLATDDGVQIMPALDVRVRSTVGAGDSFLAGLVMALAAGETPAQALARGIAAGAAATAAEGTAHVTREAVQALLTQTVGRVRKFPI